MTENYNENCILPPEGDSQVGIEAFKLVEKSIRDKEKRGLHDKWSRAYQYRRNHYFKHPSTAELPKASANFWYAHKQRVISDLAGGAPTWNVAPMTGMSGSEWEDKLSRLSKLQKFHWNERELQQIFRMSVDDAETYNCTINKVVFDPDLGWDGDVDVQIVDPFHFGTFPLNEHDPQRAQAVLHYYPVNKSVLTRQYPEFADSIKADGEVLSELDKGRDDAVEHDAHTRLSGISTSMAKLFAGNNERDNEDPDQDEECTVAEIWVIDTTSVAPEAQGMPNTGGEPDMMRPEQETNMPAGIEQNKQNEMLSAKYPGYIRMVKVCNGGLVVLEDRGNPSINPNIPIELASKTYLFDKFPFVRTVSRKDSFDCNGAGDFEQLEVLMIEINLCISQLLKDKNENLGRIIKVAQDSGVSVDDFQLGTTSYLEPTSADKGMGITVETPPASNAEVMNIFNTLRELFFQISGSFQLESADVAGGGSLAYKALQLLKEETSRLNKPKQENYDYLLREQGRMIMSMFQNWYTERRWYEYDDGSKTVQDSIEVQGNGYEYLQFPVRISVVKGSTLPDSEVQKREEIIEIVKSGILERGPLVARVALKRLNIDGWQDIVKEIEQGVNGPLMDKIYALGVPDEFMQYLSKVIDMEQEDIEKGIKDGSIPPAGMVIQQLVESGQLQPTPAEQLQQMELAEKQAKIDSIQLDNQEKQWIQEKRVEEIKKLQAEVQKIMAEAESESERALTFKFGRFLDSEMLRVKKAEVMAGRKEIAGMGPNGPYNETMGLRSNNKGI